jgi:transcription elongation GreA/GreB family factor
MIDKHQLIAELIQHLSRELKKAEIAALKAHEAATHEQSKAETQYDSLAIEAAYLAEGQSKRVKMFQHAIDQLQTLNLQTQSHNVVGLGSLVQLAQDEPEHQWYFITPAAGGYRAVLSPHWITAVTKESPMGQALLGKCLGDEVSLSIGPATITDEIVALL